MSYCKFMFKQKAYKMEAEAEKQEKKNVQKKINIIKYVTNIRLLYGEREKKAAEEEIKYGNKEKGFQMMKKQYKKIYNQYFMR